MKRPFFALIAGCLLGFSIAITPVFAQNCTDKALCVAEIEKRVNTGDVVAIMWLADYYAMGVGESKYKAAFGLKNGAVVAAVDRLRQTRGVPTRIQVDNGSEFISLAMDPRMG